jgi:hypothetical protein
MVEDIIYMFWGICNKKLSPLTILLLSYLTLDIIIVGVVPDDIV